MSHVHRSRPSPPSCLASRGSGTPHRVTWAAHGACSPLEAPRRQAVHSLSDCPVVPVRHNPARHRDPHSTPHVSSPLRRTDTAARACAVVAKDATRRQSMGRVTRSTHGCHAEASTITVQRRSGLVHYLPPMARRHDPNAIRRRRAHVERGVIRAHRGSPPPGKVDHLSTFSTTLPQSSRRRPAGERWTSAIHPPDRVHVASSRFT